MANDTRNLALTLIKRGWFVFPCNPDKTPRCKWKDVSSSNPQDVTRWWTRWPDALIGIDCEKSGIFAVDIDRHTPEADGMQSWIKLVTIFGEGKGVPVGPLQYTPSGGYHLIFRWFPYDLDIPNNTGKLGPGLDLRSNGYICSGPGYTWADDHGPEVPITDPPEWLVKNIRAMGADKPYHPGCEIIHVVGLENYFLDKYVREAKIGNRNQTAFNLACQLRDSNLTMDAARPFMLNYARRVPQTNKSRFTEREALTCLESAYSRPAREAAGKNE